MKQNTITCDECGERIICNGQLYFSLTSLYHWDILDQRRKETELCSTACLLKRVKKGELVL